MIERTLFLIKPDAVSRGLIGEIIQRLERVGIKIVAMKMVWIDSEHSKKHYAEHVGKPFYKSLEKGITEGPLVAMVLEGVHVIEAVRKLVGATEPHKAAPGTIRGDFAHVSTQYANSKGIMVKNLVHASANKADAEREIALWFSEKEINDYERVDWRIMH